MQLLLSLDAAAYHSDASFQHSRLEEQDRVAAEKRRQAEQHKLRTIFKVFDIVPDRPLTPDMLQATPRSPPTLLCAHMQHANVQCRCARRSHAHGRTHVQHAKVMLHGMCTLLGSACLRSNGLPYSVCISPSTPLVVKPLASPSNPCDFMLRYTVLDCLGAALCLVLCLVR